MNHAEMIAAIAAGGEGAARGVVRLSGEGAVECVRKVFEGEVGWDEAGGARVWEGRVRWGESGRTAPCELWWWPNEKSFMREPTAEFHTIGSPPILEGVLRRLIDAGARAARPGEFTQRAFLAGRIDLTQAEAVLGVIDARSSRELDVALAQMAGGLSSPLMATRERLLDLVAHIEADLDFADEEIDALPREAILKELDSAAETLQGLLERMKSRGEGARGARVVLMGLPNVGKSSLFNALAGREAAIVSAEPGATRDYLTAKVDCGGRSVELIDTAGVEEIAAGDEKTIGGSRPTLREEAQTAGAAQRKSAEVTLLCLDQTRSLEAWEREQIAKADDETIVVVTKCDARDVLAYGAEAVRTSAATGTGLDQLKARIAELLAEEDAAEGDVVRATAARCYEGLRASLQSIATARECAEQGGQEELVAAETRGALTHLGELVGAVYTDDILDRIFSKFCIGK